MKKLLLIIGAVLFGFANANAQCEWKIDASDNYGDGWNGGTLNVTLNGIDVPGSPYTLLDPPGSQEDFTFMTNGETVELTWTPGSFNYEVVFELIDAEGNSVYTSEYDPAAGIKYSGLTSCPACLSPTALTLDDADGTTATFSWTENGTATAWEIEYGAPGFTPGTGTVVSATTNPFQVTGLNSNEAFEAYVVSICSPTESSSAVGPLSFNTFNMPAFMQNTTDCPAGGFIDISATGTELALTDDGEVGITLDFDFYFQNGVINTLTVGNNGGIELNTLTGNVGYGGDMTFLPDGLHPWGDDLNLKEGVYSETQGTAPNRVFIVQWKNIENFGSATTGTVDFEVQIHETTNEIYFVYNDVVFEDGNNMDDYAGNADIGLAGPIQDLNVSNNNQDYLRNNTCVKFSYTDCPVATGFMATGITTNEGTVTWNAGLAGETEWTVIYGEEGFDPATGGTTIGSLTTPSLTIPSLDDLTTYDVYIYSDCNPGTLQSDGYMGSFTTLPNCSDPTGLGATGLVDSIDVAWAFTESTPAFPSTGFNLQYGSTGFDLYSGTVVMADNNLTDTIVDNTLVPGMVYDIYVQSECGTDTSNYVGPVTFTAPLTNDSVCLPVALMVDGTIYNFNNSGATVGVNEASIAPPVTGYQNTTGWGEGTIYSSTWFTFEAPASGRVKISGRDVGYYGKTAVYSVADCGDLSTFTLVGANQENEYGSYTGASEYTLCGLTAGNTYYLMHTAGASWAGTGNYSLRLEEPMYEAGTSNGILNVCTGASVDLNTGVTGSDAGGVWTEPGLAPGGFNGTFDSYGLAYQTYDFQYRIQEGCYYDSVVQQVEIYGPSSAGDDGSLTVCKNESINLVAALTGNIDLGGTWYNSQDVALASGQIMSPSLPGQYNYTYITGNGVCADDTANVTLSVDPNCDWLSIDEQSLENLSVYPNPTQGSVFVSNLNSTEVFNIAVTDLKGSVVVEMENALNGTEATEVSFENLESGIYLIKVYNDNASTIFRIVKD